MQVEQSQWIDQCWSAPPGRELGASAQVVFVFGARQVLADGRALDEVRNAYPNAAVVGCSTAGEILDTEVQDQTLTASALAFTEATVTTSSFRVDNASASRRVGAEIAASIEHDGLRHVLVFSEGLQVNGSELVKGITGALPEGVTVTGGLAGDGADFDKTLVVHGASCESQTVSVVAIYGDSVTMGYGSLGGWDTFGPERLVTRSQGSVLYELSGESALDLYKRYLGKHAAGLPSSGLLFPLSVQADDGSAPVVRTILGVNEADSSITFAGDIPQGSRVRLMKANFDRLVDGAVEAAEVANQGLGSGDADFALLISCVGRKMVLKQRIEEEVEGVRDVLGASVPLAGFYSYGEISPFSSDVACQLHNQTMTITTFREDVATQ